MFNWDSSNANKFFGLFGQEFSGWMRQQVKDDSAIEQAVREFMFVNNQRNVLVHGNFAAVSAGITFDEAWDRYRTALRFVEWLPSKLREVAAGVPAAAVQPE